MSKTNDHNWDAVDASIEKTLGLQDDLLIAALDRSRKGELPDIQVSAAQGRMLEVFARTLRAEWILEIGTLGGYSTICLARGLSGEGRVITLELDEHHARVARENVDAACVGDRVEIRVGAALDTLAMMAAEGVGPFDLAFIDADKANIPGYLDWAIKLAKPGSLIVVDNVVREGRLIDAEDQDPSTIGVRQMHDALSRDGRVLATTIQTVGSKGWDGFTLVVVKSPGT